MPSTVGLPSQRTDAEVITTAAQLEYDCVGAYGEAAKKAHHSANAEDFAKMASDCARHVNKWQGRLEALGANPASPNGLTEPANRFKVKAARWFGDGAITLAVRNNSNDSCEAYERVCARGDLSQETLDLAAEFLRDAQHHRELVSHLPHKANDCVARPTQS